MTRLILLVPLLSVSLAAAQDEVCKAPETTADAIRCEAAKLKTANRALNQAYQRLVGELQSQEPYEREARTTLVEAQRHWIAFRKKDCAAKYTARGGGSLQGWYQLNCMREHAELRTRQLNEFRMD